MPAINFKFGKATPGDEIILPSPFKFGSEVIGVLKKIGDNGRFSIHTYDLYFYGVWIGTAEAKQDGASVDWRVLA